LYSHIIAFSALTRLGIRKSIQPVKTVMRRSHGYLSWARCKWFAYDQADAASSPSSFVSLKSRMVLPFWCQYTQVFLENRPLNECSSSCIHMSLVTVYINRIDAVLLFQSAQIDFFWQTALLRSTRMQQLPSSLLVLDNDVSKPLQNDAVCLPSRVNESERIPGID